LPLPTDAQPIDGVSLVPVLRGEATSVKDHVYHAFPRPRPEKKKGEWLGRAIRTERYRYVEWRPFGTTDEKSDVELYDYTADPLETENLAPRHPDLCVQLQKLLDQHPAPVAPVLASRPR
jgi:iduronate 2-sulfatase